MVLWCNFITLSLVFNVTGYDTLIHLNSLSRLHRLRQAFRTLLRENIANCREPRILDPP
jgi:hypothetical protein